jgi:hypothetical protein
VYVMYTSETHVLRVGSQWFDCRPKCLQSNVLNRLQSVCSAPVVRFVAPDNLYILPVLSDVNKQRIYERAT